MYIISTQAASFFCVLWISCLKIVHNFFFRAYFSEIFFYTLCLVLSFVCAILNEVIFTTICSGLKSF